MLQILFFIFLPMAYKAVLWMGVEIGRATCGLAYLKIGSGSELFQSLYSLSS